MSGVRPLSRPVNNVGAGDSTGIQGQEQPGIRDIHPVPPVISLPAAMRI